MRRWGGILALVLTATSVGVIAVWWTSERAAAQSLLNCMGRTRFIDHDALGTGAGRAAAAPQAGCFENYADQRDFVSWLFY